MQTFLLLALFQKLRLQHSCQHGCQTPSDAVADRKCKFLKKLIVSDNTLCQVFKDVAMDELALLASNAY